MEDEFVARVGVWGCGCPVDTSAEGRSTDRAGRRDRITDPRCGVRVAPPNPPFPKCQS